MPVKKLVPPLSACVGCGHEYSGAICPVCKTEHPTFTAIKNISKQADEEFLLNAVALAGETC